VNIEPSEGIAVSEAPDAGRSTPTGDDRPSVVGRFAAALGCTEGQLYTMVIGLIIAVVLAILCIPTATRHFSALVPTTRASLLIAGAHVTALTHHLA
jgi:hypothetical protein